MTKNTLLQELWLEYVAALDKQFPGYSTYLNSPATKLDIQQTEEKMGITLPDELVQLYLLHNGDSNHLMGSFLGLPFLTLEEMHSHWNNWKELLENESEADMEQLSAFSTSIPKHQIKATYANRKWIPLSYDYSGNHIGIDLDPDVNGVIGQVINFGRDEDEKYVLAASLHDFLTLMIQLVKGLSFTIKMDEQYDQVVFMWQDDIHPIDGLKTIRKKTIH
ncbi:SMI1/KNR4 family protein [Priestia koreensis]|uniref:SMI1/KNR4 family protein n=1 Tax=Priestia koreensis TaxID=284581 RepID=UPI0006A9D886|nr:SMI1/KNR4 family protein [Priestia koreensis]MCM3004314.1 SMI1/KNR4 family protein [Priestia koreensis]